MFDLKMIFKNRNSVVSLLGILILIFVIQARFEKKVPGENESSFSWQVSPTIDADLQGDFLDDDDFSTDNYNQLSHDPPIVFRNLTCLHSRCDQQQNYFHVHHAIPNILMGCLRI